LILENQFQPEPVDLVPEIRVRHLIMTDVFDGQLPTFVFQWSQRSQSFFEFADGSIY